MIKLLLIASTLLISCFSPQTEAFRGTVFNKVEPAPAIRLEDQFGNPASLTDHRGRVVVLTFLYTNCPDVCPIVTAQLKETHAMLSDDAADVRFVAVSVDPEGDTPEEARGFLHRWGLTGGWSYLTGPRDQLEPIWEAYFVAPAINQGAADGVEHSPSKAGAASGAIDSLTEQITDQYRVIHSTPVYLIDRQGQRKVVSTPPLDPADLAHDVRLLLRE